MRVIIRSVFVGLFLIGAVSHAQSTIENIPVQSADANGFLWLACKGLAPQVTILGNMESVRVRAGFVKSAVVPNSKGTNLVAGTCAWSDRLVADSEPTVLFGATMNSGIEYTVANGVNEAQGLRFKNDAYLLSGDVFVVRAKRELPDSAELLINMRTLQLVK